MGTVTTRPTFPIPASARAHPTRTGASGLPAGTATTPAATTTTTTTPITTTAAITTATTVAPTSSGLGAGSGTAQPLTSTTQGARTSGRAGSHGSGHVSTEAIVIAAIAVLLLLACAVWAFARSRAYEPHWWLSLRHAMAEAGYRTSATWAEFADWARLGR